MHVYEVSSPSTSFTKRGAIACYSFSMIIVQESIADEFIALFSPEVNRLQAVPDENSWLRGLYSIDAATRLHKLVTDALEGGATIVAGSLHVESNIMQPIVLDNVTRDMGTFFNPSFGLHRGLKNFCGE